MADGRELGEAELDALMARLADGDRAAFDPLFRALHPRALRVASRQLEPAHAADAAQSTLLAVFARAAEFTPGRPVLPWFYAIAANEIRALTRRASAARKRAGDPAVALGVRSDGDPEQELMDRELRRALSLAVDALDDGSANAVRTLLGDQERPAIGGAAFRKRLSRAYARLRVLLVGGPHEG